MSISPRKDALNFTSSVSTHYCVQRSLPGVVQILMTIIFWIARQQWVKWNLVGLARRDILQFIVIRNSTVMAVLMLFQFATLIICKGTITAHAQERSASNFYFVWCNFCIVFRLYFHLGCIFCFFCIICATRFLTTSWSRTVFQSFLAPTFNTDFKRWEAMISVNVII